MAQYVSDCSTPMDLRPSSMSMVLTSSEVRVLEKRPPLYMKVPSSVASGRVGVGAHAEPGDERGEEGGLIVKELEHARKKYPHFCDALLDAATAAAARALLDGLRRVRREEAARGCHTAGNILLCEVYEALEALALGDYAHAKTELAQVAAVCLRVMRECDGRRAGVIFKKRKEA